MEYLYTNIKSTDSYQGDWGSYLEIKFFSTNDSIQQVLGWYEKNGFKVENSESYHFTAYLYNEENKPIYSVCASANSTNEDSDEFYSFEELNAYIQSDSLEALHKKNHKVICVLFQHDPAYVPPKVSGRGRQRGGS